MQHNTLKSKIRRFYVSRYRNTLKRFKRRIWAILDVIRHVIVSGIPLPDGLQCGSIACINGKAVPYQTTESLYHRETPPQHTLSSSFSDQKLVAEIFQTGSSQNRLRNCSLIMYPHAYAHNAHTGCSLIYAYTYI